MKNKLLILVFFLITAQLSYSQAWMTNLDIAQRLALVENKMVLMVWEGTTEYPYPVFVNDNSGRRVYISNLFLDEEVSPLIWEHFVPVIVNEDQYGVLYAQIKGKRNKNYIDKFNDNSIKIMDVNGNILNARDFYYEDLQNISDIIQNYSLNTEYITPELRGYHTEKSFYSSYFLASKYMDFSMYAKAKLKPDLLALSNIYLNEAREFANNESPEQKLELQQRCNLLEIQQYLLLKRPKKVLRQLKKMDADEIENSNTSFVAFLFYTAHMSLGDVDKAEKWKSKISSVNLKKAQMLINLNS